MATTLNRRPLSTRQHLLQPFGNSPQKSRTSSVSVKRPRSPEPAGDVFTAPANPKRVRPTPPEPGPATAQDEERRDKEQRRQAREAAKNEFRIKYTRAFPSWAFYFDLDQLDPESEALRNSLVARVSHLGARVHDFFSSEITHLITNQTVPPEEPNSNKENARRSRGSLSRAVSLLKSPIRLKGRAGEDGSTNFNLIEKAQAFDMKIWTTAKLDSILERCDVPAPLTTSAKQVPGAQVIPVASATNQRNLTRLLASERVHGTTERDPTQKRHDFRYFSKSSCFVLVEDVKQELATIHALEYPIQKGRDGKELGAWPVLYCHPNARGPFIEYDERERRRWEKSRRAEEDKEAERQERVARELKRKKQAQAQLMSRKAGDLRRSVSMNNLHRQVANGGIEDLVDLDADFLETQGSANASGFLASTGTGAYIAASGNSVGITSTTGTTSTAGALRALDLPANLRGRIQQQVLTSRKASSLAAGKDSSNRKLGAMGPPVGIPERPNGLLRKSRSTNTLRLPKRDEGSKPGYCESCRVKFEDFEYHIRDRKHRKFAMDDANYLQLDFVLGRVQRRTRQEYERQERHYLERHEEHVSSDAPEAYLSSPPLRAQEDDSMWDDEMDAEGELVDLDL
ncbi:hypothetical protein HYDPIDRAFT_37299 [Hydnomerulius pinastri MD-312]|nr:hypothetical protein HYDPIDRAFT_37299 [Hydnomerulius pinastri MD-312]